MESEAELIPLIARLSHQSRSLEEAIELFQTALTGEIGDSILVVEPVNGGSSPLVGEVMARFMESRVFPFRGLYTAPLLVGNRKVGRLVACFGSFGAPGKALSGLTEHIAQQLGEILGRTRRTLGPQVVPISVSQTKAA